MFNERILVWSIIIQTVSCVVLVCTSKPEMNLFEGFISGLGCFVFFLAFLVAIAQLLMLILEKLGGGHGKSL